MTTVSLRIEPQFCGPVSVGTVTVVKSLHEHFGLSLKSALDYVNRCVFEGERVEIPAPSAEAARDFCAAVARLPDVPRVSARLLEA